MTDFKPISNYTDEELLCEILKRNSITQALSVDGGIRECVLQIGPENSVLIRMTDEDLDILFSREPKGLRFDA